MKDISSGHIPWRKDRFVTKLRQKSKDCEFGPIDNDMLRDKLVFNITNTSLKERLLRENDLSLHRACEICRATELAKTQIQAMQSATVVQDSQVNAIEGFHDASSDWKSPYWRHSASQQSTGTEVYPERRQGKWLIIAVFQVVPIGQIEKNIWNIIDFQKLLKTRERNARDYQRKGGACGWQSSTKIYEGKIWTTSVFVRHISCQVL